MCVNCPLNSKSLPCRVRSVKCKSSVLEILHFTEFPCFGLRHWKQVKIGNRGLTLLFVIYSFNWAVVSLWGGFRVLGRKRERRLRKRDTRDDTLPSPPTLASFVPQLASLARQSKTPITCSYQVAALEIQTPVPAHKKSCSVYNMPLLTAPFSPSLHALAIQLKLKCLISSYDFSVNGYVMQVPKCDAIVVSL